MSGRREHPEFDDELGVRIADATEAYAPDPDDFLREVEQRTERRESSRVIPTFVRRAAALLPPVLLPLSLARTGAAATATAAKGGSWKFLPGVLAMPAVIAVMIFATFFVSLRAAVVRGEQRDEARSARHAVAQWWRRNMVLIIVVMLVVAFTVTITPTDGLLLIFGISMLGFVGIVNALAREGFATRRELGLRMSAFLFFLSPYSISAAMSSQDWMTTATGSGLLGLIAVISGAVVCSGLAVGFRDFGSKIRVGFAITAVVILGSMHTLGVQPLSKVMADRGYAIRFVEEWDELDGHARWEHFIGMVEQLRNDGQTPPQLDAAQARFHAYLDGLYASDTELNSLYATELELVGFLRDEDRQRFRSDYWERHGVAAETSIVSPRHALLNVSTHSRFEPYDDATRARVARRVLDGLRHEDIGHDPEKLLARAALLDLVGDADDHAALQTFAHRKLRELWSGYEGADRAAFFSSPDLIERDAAGTPIEQRLSFIWLSTTSQAVQLMARYGVPEGVDLHALDAYLTDMSLYYSYRRFDSNAALAAAAHSRLHALAEWTPRPEPNHPLLWWIYRQRLLIGGILLALFCVVVTARAPEATENPAAGTA